MQEELKSKTDACVWQPILSDLQNTVKYKTNMIFRLTKWGYEPFDMLVATEQFLYSDDNKEIIYNHTF